MFELWMADLEAQAMEVRARSQELLSEGLGAGEMAATLEAIAAGFRATYAIASTLGGLVWPSLGTGGPQGARLTTEPVPSGLSGVEPLRNGAVGPEQLDREAD